jgi:LAO/AO transport system kinase
MLGGRVEAPSPGGRAQPRHPEVLLVSALTGQGVAELLEALDRRGDALASGDDVDAARLARAEAQVTGIILDRTRAALREPSRRADTEATLRAVAAHEVDPYAAADTLLGSMDKA